MARRFLIMGPPGSGKGTHARAIAERFGVPAISTGDIFRGHVKAKTDLGVTISDLIAGGDFVPDEITNEVVRLRLAEADCANGFLLDGYPRTLNQVAALDSMLDGHTLSAVILLGADDEELIRRMVRRGVEENRADDTEETVRYRQTVYRDKTQPLLDVYGDRGLIVPVDAMGSIEEVDGRIGQALDSFLNS